MTTPYQIGWPLLPLPDQDGQLRYPSLEQSVRQSIQVILRTRPGEQLMRSSFGAGLEELLHEPNTVGTRRRVRDLIMAALRGWEPRIILDRVDVQELPDQPTYLRVEIGYRLVRSGQAQSIRMTMELEA